MLHRLCSIPKQPSMSNSSRRLRFIRSARLGAVTVELALTISLAFFFFFAALELSRVAMLRHTIENAVYEGARVGALPGGSSNEVKDEVRRVLRIVGVRNSDITTSPETIAIDTPDIEVSVRVPLAGNLYFPPLFFQNKVLERTFRMQRETQNINRLD